MVSPEVQAAEARAAIAKIRLRNTAAELQARISPANVADDVKKAAVRNKVPLVGVAGAMGLFLVRRPIGTLIARMFTPRSKQQQTRTA